LRRKLGNVKEFNTCQGEKSPGINPEAGSCREKIYKGKTVTDNMTFYV